MFGHLMSLIWKSAYRKNLCFDLDVCPYDGFYLLRHKWQRHPYTLKCLHACQTRRRLCWAWVVLFNLLCLMWLLVLPLVRFDPNSRCRLLPQTRVPWPRSEGELHCPLQPPAAHPLPAVGAEGARSPCPPEKIHRFKPSYTGKWWRRSRVSATTERRHPKWPWRGLWRRSSPWQRLQTRRKAEATLLWKTQEMYVRALSHWSTYGVILHNTFIFYP